ncbi:MAG TPA: hypothetical protein PLG56_12565 [Lacunisphaera sp.]|jgi:hypothetical protein|nr:hypothetical protein [Lacunisphaera sp.]
MAEGSDYRSHLSLEAAAFLVSLPRRQQKRVLDLADQIARQPFQIGDYQTADAEDRDVENLLLDEFLFSFWVDHATREVRISEIIKV